MRTGNSRPLSRNGRPRARVDGRMAGRRIPPARLPLAACALALPALWLASAAAQEAGGSGGSGSGGESMGDPAPWLDTLLHWTIRGIEVVGIGTIVVGAVVTSALYLVRTLREGPTDAGYHRFRSGLGRSILLGLEFLVAADIINTVAIDPTLESVAVLAGVVAVRTFLSFALEVEIDGKWPWHKGSG